jgi:hypothetical protein
MLSKISNISFFKKSLRIPKGKSESVYRRRTDNTMAKRKTVIVCLYGQLLHEEEVSEGNIGYFR